MDLRCAADPCVHPGVPLSANNCVWVYPRFPDGVDFRQELLVHKTCNDERYVGVPIKR
jgi:hypothetical protein